MNNEKLAKAAVSNILKFMAIKWVIIFGVTRALRKAAEKKS